MHAGWCRIHLHGSFKGVDDQCHGSLLMLRGALLPDLPVALLANGLQQVHGPHAPLLPEAHIRCPLQLAWGCQAICQGLHNGCDAPMLDELQQGMFQEVGLPDACQYALPQQVALQPAAETIQTPSWCCCLALACLV